MSEHDEVEPGLDDTPIEAALRGEVRAWMDEHAGRFGRCHGAAAGAGHAGVRRREPRLAT